MKLIAAIVTILAIQIMAVTFTACSFLPPPAKPAVVIVTEQQQRNIEISTLGRITMGFARNDDIKERTALLLKQNKLQPRQAKNARYLADVAWIALDKAQTLFAEGKIEEALAALKRADTVHGEAELQNTLTQDKPRKGK